MATTQPRNLQHVRVSTLRLVAGPMDPHWYYHTVLIWTEDDAPVPDKERVHEAWERIFKTRAPWLQPSTRQPIHKVDLGDWVAYVYSDGRVMTSSPEGAEIRLMVKLIDEEEYKDNCDTCQIMERSGE